MRPEVQSECLLRVSACEAPIAERADAKRDLVSKLRRNVVQGLFKERLHGGRRLLDAYARFEPRKDPQNGLPGSGPAIGGSIEGRGNQNVIVTEVGHFELRRENTDNESGASVE